MSQLSPSAAVDFGPQTPAVETVLAQIRAADTLTFALAAVPVLPSRQRSEHQRPEHQRPDHQRPELQRHATVTAWRAARDSGRASAWGAAWAASCSLVGDQPAAVDAAVAEVVRDLVSREVYAALAHPWQAAVAVREELRRLGQIAESLAAGLLQLGWTNAVQELPDVARGTLAA